MFKEKMVTPAIPERVYTLCKMIESKPISLSELKGKMEPDYLNQNSSYFNDYRTVAEELGLINVYDNMAELAVAPSVIKSMSEMRKYINGRLEEYQNGPFYQVTKAYFSLNREVLHSKMKNISEMAPLINPLINGSVDAVALRAWRFWVSYLGFGYLQDMFFIPNASVFLCDVINTAEFEKDRRYSFGEFISRILPYSGIVMDSSLTNRQMGYGVSNGLRTLHDAGIIKLEHILDQEDIWNLDPLNAHSISTTVTNITICK